MPNQLDMFVIVAGFLRALMHLGDKDVVESTEKWMTQLQQDMDAGSRELEAAMAEFERVQSEAFKALAKGGWLGMERHFTDSQARAVLAICETQGEVAMNDAIANYFNKTDCAVLSEMILEWVKIPYMRNRETIIQDAFSAHREGRFSLSVPSLLPLAEGLSAEIAGTTVGNQNVVKAVAREWKEREAEVWSQVFADVIEQTIYRRYDFEADPAPFLSRHGILHGRVPDYATAINSVRVFLLIDSIAALWLEKQRKLSR
jgi:hypothetical protein